MLTAIASKRSPLSLALAVLGVMTASACTDWDAAAGHPVLATHPGPGGGTDDAAVGLVYWDTLGVAQADAGGAGDTADSGELDAAGDAPGAEDSSPSFDIYVPGDTGLADAAGGALCAGPDRPVGCECTASAQCESGLCVYGAGGLVCSSSCLNANCPAGWTCSAPTYVCLPPEVADAGSSSDADAGPSADTADANPADAPLSDLGPQDTAAVADTTAGPDAADADPADAPLPDVSPQDSVTDADAGPAPDADTTAGADTADADPADAPLPDAGPDAPEPDTLADTLADAVQDVEPDGGLFDVSSPDVGQTDVGNPDNWVAPDWGGYPDAVFPDDADVYGGAINSCLALYLYQQESCGKESPTAACIDEVAKEGSLYANFLFEPLRACQTSTCVDLCAASSDVECMNTCIARYCPNPFLACVSNNEKGVNDCGATFSCAMGYEGKLLTIGSKCYAAGNLSAQLQLGNLISCVTKPQTDSCFLQIANCYDAGSAATSSCQQTLMCATQECNNNEECVWKCLGKATPTARLTLDALGDCITAVCGPKCGGDQACEDNCIATDCGAQFSACMSN